MKNTLLRLATLLVASVIYFNEGFGNIGLKFLSLLSIIVLVVILVMEWYTVPHLPEEQKPIMHDLNVPAPAVKDKRLLVTVINKYEGQPDQKVLCVVKFSQSEANGRLIIDLLRAADNQKFLRATLNFPDENLEPNQVFLRNYADAEGIRDVLEDAGIIRCIENRKLKNGLTVPLCEVLVDPGI